MIAALSSIAWLWSGKNFAWWNYALVKWSEVLGWINFVETLHLVLDSVNVADWKESHYRLGPVYHHKHTGFWNEIHNNNNNNNNNNTVFIER